MCLLSSSDLRLTWVQHAKFGFKIYRRKQVHILVKKVNFFKLIKEKLRVHLSRHWELNPNKHIKETNLEKLWQFRNLYIQGVT